MTDQALRRKQRLAAALRENLKRRKVQQRVRSVHDQSATGTVNPAVHQNLQEAAEPMPTLAQTDER